MPKFTPYRLSFAACLGFSFAVSFFHWIWGVRFALISSVWLTVCSVSLYCVGMHSIVGLILFVAYLI